jgi:hypothetical protein
MALFRKVWYTYESLCADYNIPTIFIYCNVINVKSAMIVTSEVRIKNKVIEIIIIIIIGKDTISFMQDIYTYIPETNHVPKE